jgi:dienelactone hydrolase
MPTRGNRLNLDTAYTNRLGQPRMRMTFEYADNERMLSVHAAKSINELAERLKPTHLVKATERRSWSSVPCQSTHHTGGTIMGTNPTYSVTNKDGQVWDVNNNPFFTGASLFPHKSACNPTVPVGALACFAAEAIKNQCKHHRRRRLRDACAAAAVCLVAAAAPAAPAMPAGQPVTVESLDRSGGQPVALPGHWFRADLPSGPAGAAAPALVLLHGCGGPYGAPGPAGPRLAVRMLDYAGLINSLGVHVLVTDSLTPRGEKELCTQRAGTRRVTQVERRRDALGALRWLAVQPGVDATRLGLLGWSHGGSAVLAATDAGHPEVARANPRPALAVAFYPGCAAALSEGWRPAAPLLLLVGEADDWTPAEPCRRLAARAGAPAVAFESYPGAHHGFDGTAPVRLRRDVPNGARPGQGVHVGGDPAARAASREQLSRFLRAQWQLP